VDKTFTYTKQWQVFVGVLRGHHSDAKGFYPEKKSGGKKPMMM
jgi:hypothetical protein